MPAQTVRTNAVRYSYRDTAPPLRACLTDGDDEPIDLSGSTVTIDIAFALPHQSYYTSPRDYIVLDGPCIIDPDQAGEGKGWVEWHPQEGDLDPPGRFLYTFRITYPDGSKQTVPPDTYLPMIILSPVGGVSARQT